MFEWSLRVVHKNVLCCIFVQWTSFTSPQKSVFENTSAQNAVGYTANYSYFLELGWVGINIKVHFFAIKVLSFDAPICGLVHVWQFRIDEICLNKGATWNLLMVRGTSKIAPTCTTLFSSFAPKNSLRGIWGGVTFICVVVNSTECTMASFTKMFNRNTIY